MDAEQRRRPAGDRERELAAHAPPIRTRAHPEIGVWQAYSHYPWHWFFSE